ncbi:hypothetical protein HK098_006729 [Nowakowskiella sp. JEL0407]|nr:hypothetical protein HK098_006729 [Nowakowskiella sp. JEL0407]
MATNSYVGSLAEIKNGKVIFKEKKLSFKNHSSTIQDLAAFNEYKNSEKFSTEVFPVEFYSLIAKLVQESDATIGQLVKLIRAELFPNFGESEEVKTLSDSSVSAAINSVATRQNYGILNGPANLTIWRWETKHLALFPDEIREIVLTRRKHRETMHEELVGLYESIPEEEKQTLVNKRKRKSNVAPGDEIKENEVEAVSVIEQTNPTTVSTSPQREKKPEKRLKKEEKKPDSNQKSITGFFTRIAEPKPAPVAKKESDELGTLDASFKPFFVKTNVHMAPLPHKRPLSDDFETIIEKQSEKVSFENWRKDLPKVEIFKKRSHQYLYFHENIRPPYYGLTKRSKVVTGRRPLAKDSALDYEVDSDDEWEDDESGEDVNSIGDEEEEPMMEDDEDGFIVAEGYFSEDEGDIEIKDVDRSAVAKMSKTPLKPIIIEVCYTRLDNPGDPQLEGLGVFFFEDTTKHESSSEKITATNEDSTQSLPSTPTKSKSKILTDENLRLFCQIVEGSSLNKPVLVDMLKKQLPPSTTKVQIQATFIEVAIKTKSVYSIKEPYRVYLDSSDTNLPAKPENVQIGPADEELLSKAATDEKETETGFGDVDMAISLGMEVESLNTNEETEANLMTIDAKDPHADTGENVPITVEMDLDTNTVVVNSDPILVDDEVVVQFAVEERQREDEESVKIVGLEPPMKEDGGTESEAVIADEHTREEIQSQNELKETEESLLIQDLNTDEVDSVIMFGEQKHDEPAADTLPITVPDETKEENIEIFVAEKQTDDLEFREKSVYLAPGMKELELDEAILNPEIAIFFLESVVFENVDRCSSMSLELLDQLVKHIQSPKVSLAVKEKSLRALGSYIYDVSRQISEKYPAKVLESVLERYGMFIDKDGEHLMEGVFSVFTSARKERWNDGHSAAIKNSLRLCLAIIQIQDQRLNEMNNALVEWICNSIKDAIDDMDKNIRSDLTTKRMGVVEYYIYLSHNKKETKREFSKIELQMGENRVKSLAKAWESGKINSKSDTSASQTSASIVENLKINQPKIEPTSPNTTLRISKRQSRPRSTSEILSYFNGSRSPSRTPPKSPPENLEPPVDTLKLPQPNLPLPNTNNTSLPSSKRHSRTVSSGELFSFLKPQTAQTPPKSPNSNPFIQNDSTYKSPSKPIKKAPPPPPPSLNLKLKQAGSVTNVPLPSQVPTQSVSQTLEKPVIPEKPQMQPNAPPLPPRPTSPTRQRARSANTVSQNDPFFDSRKKEDSNPFLENTGAFSEDEDEEDDVEGENVETEPEFFGFNRSIPIPHSQLLKTNEMSLRSCISPRNVAIHGFLVSYSSQSSTDSYARVTTFENPDSNQKISLIDNITSISFVPVSWNKVLDGNYTPKVWIGFANGDILGYDTVQLKRYDELSSRVHDTSVTFLLPNHATSSMCSIDENGSFAIWTASSNSGIPSLRSRPTMTKRTSAHQSSAHLHSQSQSLWTASLKQLSIYSLTNESLAKYPKCEGNITCISSIQNNVITGHDDGQIYIWDTPQSADWKPSPIQKILAAQYRSVTSILGVTASHIWAGFSTGKIQIYYKSDVSSPTTSESKFSLIKEFKAFNNAEVSMLVENGGYIVKEKLWCVTAVSENGQIRVFDGLLKRDWLDNQLSLQKSKFSTFRPVNVFISTWNINSRKADQIDNAGGIPFSQTWAEIAQCCPDIVVFGLQEIVDLQSKKVQAQTIFQKARKPDSSSNGSPRSQAWQSYFNQELRYAFEEFGKLDYIELASREMVGLYLIVFAKKDPSRRYWGNVVVTKTQTGMKGYHGNKGSIAIRLTVDDSSFCFINCHLAAHQTHISSRNNDAASIIRDTVFKETSNIIGRSGGTQEYYFTNGGDGSSILDHEKVFLFGDLNYRIDLDRETVLEAIQRRNWEKLMKHDQLLVQKSESNIFVLREFRENPLTFAPTFKFDPGLDSYDSSEKRRTPAWCDRILYLGENIEQLVYASVDCRASDHRPVVSLFRVLVKKVNDEIRRDIMRNEIEPAWESYMKSLLNQIHR